MKIRIYQIDGDKDINRVKFDSFESMKKYSGLEQPDASIYENVYEGSVSAKSLEGVYSIFNMGERPGEFRGHSLSKSDIVEVINSPNIVGKIDCPELGWSNVYTDLVEYNLAQENLRDRDVDFDAHDYVGLNVPSVEPGFYYCDTFGFKKVEFDPSLTFKRDDLIKVVLLEPGQEARIVEIGPSLREMQCVVQGHLETSSPFNDNVCIVCNDEGKLMGLPPNRAVIDPDSNTVTDILAGICFICAVKGGEFVGLSDKQLEQYKEMFFEPQKFVRSPSGYWKVSSSLSDRISAAQTKSQNSPTGLEKDRVPNKER